MAGCLIPAILMTFRAAIGAIVGSDGGSVYGAFIGLAVGMLAMVVMVFLMSMAKR
jgi:tetrahydromethanopterin S-methyltransferase subunit G